jgi:hypothetical protein
VSRWGMQRERKNRGNGALDEHPYPTRMHLSLGQIEPKHHQIKLACGKSNQVVLHLRHDHPNLSHIAEDRHKR